MLRTVLSCCLTATLLAQDLRWQLPPRGAALYDRDLKVETGDQQARRAPPWYGEPAGAVVLAGELDARRQRSTEPCIDLRDLIAYVALDLSSVKSLKARSTLAATAFLPIDLEVQFDAVDDSGNQAFTATLAAGKAPERAPPTGPTTPRITGTLRGSRTLDRAQGRLAGFDGTLTLTVAHPAHKDANSAQAASTVQFTIRDRWTFTRVLAPGDAEFRTMVADGIRKGAAAVRKALEQSLRRTPRKADDPYHDVAPGELGLYLLTLIKAGEDARDDLLVHGYDQLRRANIEGTYSLACAILATEALYTPASEWIDLRAGRLKAPMPRVLADADRSCLQLWVPDLLDNIDTTVDAAYLRRWHYGPSQSFDNSNTQYALLGLFAAQLCGQPISPQIWTAAGNHWLDCKVAAGEPAAPQIVTHQDLQKQAAAGGRGTRTRGGKVPPLGWSYGHRGEPTGSMTCAGITGLTLAASGLRAQKKGNAQLLREFDDATRSGFLWLEQNLSVRRNPGPAASWTSWLYYYLYGLERTCELNQVALLGDRDWYFEGAMQLLRQQRPDGSWGGGWDTCFAVLFLKKTALPAITPR